MTLGPMNPCLPSLIGVILADFIRDGTTPCCRDQQNRWLRNGASRSATGDRVGNTEEDCLSGSARTMAATSYNVTGENTRNSQPTGAEENCDAGAPAMHARTPATLASKKRWRTYASMPAGGSRPRPSSRSKDRHRR